MKGYTTQEVAELLAVSEAQVRSYVRAGFLNPRAGARGRYLFSFQDLVLMRTAKGLMEAKIPARRVKKALRQLENQLPEGRPLSGVSISVDGKHVVVRDGATAWNPENGQGVLNFEVAGLVRQVAPMVKREAAAEKKLNLEPSATQWYERGCDVELVQPMEAREAYRRAVELDPMHAGAHVNLGRLLHEMGELSPAEAHYRLAISVEPTDPTAWFNLGVVLEDLGRELDAIEAYEYSIKADQKNPDVHFNLARLYERQGRTMLAVRHLRTYQQLTQY